MADDTFLADAYDVMEPVIIAQNYHNTVRPVDSHPARAGFLIATGETREEAIEQVCWGVNQFHIETVDGI